jgi:hypothetical protein
MPNPLVSPRPFSLHSYLSAHTDACEKLDDLFCPRDHSHQREGCRGNYKLSESVRLASEFERSDLDDIFGQPTTPHFPTTRSIDIEPYNRYDNRMLRRHTKRKRIPGTVRPERKERVTITLSRRSAEYVKSISAKERSHVSTVMERMIEATRRAQELKQLNADISAFYDALPDAAVLEDATWGQVGATGLAALVESEAHADIYEAAPKADAR